jgi:rod shape-determining protein MreD
VRVALAIVVPLAAALLQGSVVPSMAIADARPNLVILAAASWSVAAGPREAVWWAFLGGVAADLLSGGPLGALALAGLVPVAVAGFGDRQLRPRSVVAGALLVALASAATSVLYYLILAVVGASLPDAGRLVPLTISGAAYNGVLAIATYPLCRTLHRSTEKQASFEW